MKGSPYEGAEGLETGTRRTSEEVECSYSLIRESGPRLAHKKRSARVPSKEVENTARGTRHSSPDAILLRKDFEGSKVTNHEEDGRTGFK
jgi:hypothetical protein